ncbi:MAG: YihY/virulence factor BrkB family protein, partial [Muribaculaceae bacterium]|nr:YihY/virulence factor BrkB family protein [Muribaculaceae bacterium]
MKSKIELLQSKLKKAIDYCMGGVWSDTRSLWRVNIVKTLNLSVKSFLNRDIQSQACAMTYRTTLALVPAIALIFAIGRGFGLQEVIKHELLTNFSSQQKLLTMVFDYADSYISESTSGGLFVGIG